MQTERDGAVVRTQDSQEPVGIPPHLCLFVPSKPLVLCVGCTLD